MEKAAFLFPGQGAQAVGMGRQLWEVFPEARARFDEADAILGFPLSETCFEGPDEALRETQVAQPALFVTECAALDSFHSRCGVEPFAVAGHSVGEYAALYAAGVVSFEGGLELVRKRAEAMQRAAEQRPGAMSAVLGLDAEAIRAICQDVRETGVVAIANRNAPGQIVISGEREAVERAGVLAKERGAKRVIPLAVSGGFHSPLMSAAGDSLYPALREAGFKNPRVPVVANATAEYVRHGVDIAPLLTMQVSGSVLWEDSMRLLLNDGVTLFAEFGVGNVLSGLIKRIGEGQTALSITNPVSLALAVEKFSANPAPSVG